jgi:photosystem II stability/assembly factor-like uncharacterized protein
VRSLAIHPLDPDVALAGTSGGQIYLSRDGGESWADPGPSQPFLGWVVAALRFDPNRGADPAAPGRLWAALWGVWGGGLVAYSDDLGASWTYRREAGSCGQIYSLVLVPGKEGWLYAGTRRGVWASRDGGLSWSHLTAALPEIQKVTSLLIEPERPETVFAGSWQRVYRSDDGGVTWRGVFTGMVPDSEVFSLTPVPGRPGEMWASTCGWVYRSADGGISWTRRQEGLKIRRVPSFAALADGRLLAGTVAGAYLSADGGDTWARATEPHLAVLALAHHPARPERVLLGTEGSGVWISTDGAATFRRAARGMTNVRIAALLQAGQEVLAAVNHAGPASGIHRSIDGGWSFELQLAGIPAVLGLAALEGRVYAATEAGLFERVGGEEWRKVAELGDRRVEAVEAAAGRLVARVADGLFELAGPRFAPVAYRHGPPRSAVPWADALWVTDGDGLYRLDGAGNHQVPVPAPPGRLAVLADRLLLSGGGGVWQWRGEGALWAEVDREAKRVLPTGDARYPCLLLDASSARLCDREGAAPMPLALPVPAHGVTSAVVVGERLLLGTAGYGVWSRRDPAP